jgi:hypothetical protein
MADTNWNDGRFVSLGINDPFDRLVHEGYTRPGEDGEDGSGGDAKEEPPHLGDREGMIAGIALREKRMAVRIVPDGKRLVEDLAPHGEVDQFDNRVEEEEHRDGVGREVVHVAAFHHQVHSHQSVLRQQQEQRHLRDLRESVFENIAKRPARDSRGSLINPSFHFP